MPILKIFAFLILLHPLFNFSLDEASKPFNTKDMIEVILVYPSIYHKGDQVYDTSIKSTCLSWHLTNEDIKSLLKYSEEYDYYPYSLYYQLPCEINGYLKLENEFWKFTINGGGSVVLRRGHHQKFYGCNQIKCESLVLLYTDFMGD